MDPSKESISKEEEASELIVEQEESVEEDMEGNTRHRHPTDASLLLKVSRLLPPDYADKAHAFESFHDVEVSCDMCNSAGGMIRCSDCGLVVCQEQGDCHAQAMVTTHCEKNKEQAASSDVKSVKFDDSSEMENSLRRMIHRKSVYDRPHSFQMHTYGTPTYCAVCQGLLVGLWSQGLQCRVCSLNTHKGEGRDGHDDCRLEALLWPCAGTKLQEEHVITVREAMRLSPNFIKDVTDQIGKDLHSHAKDIIVGAGVDEERTKKFRRLKLKTSAIMEALDAIEERGELYCIYILLRMYAILSLVVLVVGLVLFNISLLPKLGFGIRDASAFYLVTLHEMTAFCTIHLCVIPVTIMVRYCALIFLRKSMILDRFLRDMFGLDAEEDLGISVAAASRRARSWSDRMLISSIIACSAAFLLWTVRQPTLEELTAELHAKYMLSVKQEASDEL